METTFEDFIGFVRNEYTNEELNSIAEFGFANCGVGEFQYYHNVTQFWDDNREWLEGCLEDWAFNWLEVDIKQLIAGCTIHDKLTQFDNIRMEILWRALEFAANYITFDENMSRFECESIELEED